MTVTPQMPQLLARGDHARLLAKYEPVILGRCIAELRGHLDADDVAQDVKLRLWRELHAGKSYSVPFRVVVHKVIGWTLKRLLRRPPDARAAAGGLGPGRPERRPRRARSTATRSRRCSTTLEGKTRQVMELRYLERLEIDQIAERLGMKRNAVDQALHRGHAQATGDSDRWLISSCSCSRSTSAGSPPASGPTCASTWTAPATSATSSPRLVDAVPPVGGGARAGRGRGRRRAGVDRGRGAARRAARAPRAAARGRGRRADRRASASPAAREKVARRYHELETGQLDARRADPALLDELAALFKARVARSRSRGSRGRSRPSRRTSERSSR